MHLGLILLIGLGLPPQQARAEDADPESKAADEVVAAAQAGDTKALEALALRDDPDPWLVADELLRRGAGDIAEAFARADGRPEMIFLPAYVRDGATLPTLAASRKALTAMRRAVASGSNAAALAAVPEASGKELVHLPGAQIAYLQGDLLSELNRGDESAQAYERAAQRARAIGWDTMASDALFRAGYMYWLRSDFTRAVAVFREHMVVEEALRSPMGTGRAHFRISSALYPLGNTKEADRHRSEAKRLAGESGDSLYAAKCLADEGIAQARRGQTEQALETFIAASDALDRLDYTAFPARMRPRPERVASSRAGSLSNAASMALKLRRGDEAQRLLQQASDIAADSGSARLARTTRASLERLMGVRAMHAGQYVTALPHLEMARQLYAALGNQAELADVLTRIGIARSSLGDLPASVARLEEAIAILTQAGAKRKLIAAHLTLASVCTSLGRLSDARVHATTGLGLARQLGETSKLADALLTLSEVHRLAARYGEAVEACNEATTILRDHPDGGRRADALIERAKLENDLGQYERSRASMEQALEILTGTVWTSKRAAALQFLAISMANANQSAAAAKALDEAIAFLRGGGARGRLAGALSLKAELLLREGDPEKYPLARKYAEESTRLFATLGTSIASARAQITLGRALAWTHEHGRASQELQVAHKTSVDLASVHSEANARMAQAEAAYVRSAFADGVIHAKQGAALLRNVGLDLDELARVAARGTLEALTRWGLANAVEAGDQSAIYEFIERGRASALVASLGGRAAIREARIPEALRLAEDDARARSAMAYQRLEDARTNGRRKEIRALRSALDEARAAEANALGAIQRTVRAQADLAYAAPAPIADVQGLLSEGERLVLFGMTGYRYFACVVTPDSLRVVRLESAKKINAAADALIKAPDDAEHLAALRRLIIDPLALDKSVTRLLASPAGPLTYMPYGALLPTREVSLVPSATALTVLRGTRLPQGRHVLALGNPSYADRPDPPISYGSRLRGAEDSERGGRLIPLPGTEAEAKAVGDVVLLGKNASETMFRRVLGRQKRWRAVHFACHGLLDDVHATRCALALTHDAQNDGLLHANELFAQVEVAADLVVLSGCETGRGRVQSGEGLQGLSRAFMLSGAPRVLASLWRVDDQATRALMTRFYELWNPKAARVKALSAAEALRQAQAFVRGHEQWKAPKYWAAWVLWGLPE